jgi:hypothetical protein
MSYRKLIAGCAMAGLVAPMAWAGDVDWLPPDPPSNAQAGECYARFHIEPEYDSWAERFVTQDTYETHSALPPRLREESHDYVSREAGMRYIVHEPVYEMITETVQIRPAYNEYVVQPARHETVTETVLIREPRMVWRRGQQPGATMTRYDSETGEIWCLVEEAGEYQTVTRDVIVEPSHVREVNHPAEFATIQREVLVQPARVEEIPIEPRYASYTSQVVAQHASVDTRVIAEESQTVTRYRMRTEERWEWRLVNCDDLDMPSHGNAMPPVASNTAPSTSSGNTYLYGDNAPASSTYSEEVPVAQASYSASSRTSRSRNRQ